MITIRAMTEADDEITSQIAAACYRFTAGPDQLTREQLGGALREWCTPQYMSISRAKDIAVVAEIDGTVVGFAGTRGDSLQEMFVHPAHHRRGVGKALFDRAEQTVAACGHLTLRVKTTTSALPFYEAMGMRQVDTYAPESGAFVGKEMFILEKNIRPQERTA
jgi:GNAT superfamily N-acetyltransferase